MILKHVWFSLITIFPDGKPLNIVKKTMSWQDNVIKLILWGMLLQKMVRCMVMSYNSNTTIVQLYDVNFIVLNYFEQLISFYLLFWAVNPHVQKGAIFDSLIIKLYYSSLSAGAH